MWLSWSRGEVIWASGRKESVEWEERVPPAREKNWPRERCDGGDDIVGTNENAP